MLTVPYCSGNIFCGVQFFLMLFEYLVCCVCEFRFSRLYSNNNLSIGAKIVATVSQAKPVNVLHIETGARIKRLTLSIMAKKYFYLAIINTQKTKVVVNIDRCIDFVVWIEQRNDSKAKAYRFRVRAASTIIPSRSELEK